MCFVFAQDMLTHMAGLLRKIAKPDLDEDHNRSLIRQNRKVVDNADEG